MHINMYCILNTSICYLAEQCKDEIVDRDLAMEGHGEAHEEHCMMYKERWSAGSVQTPSEHVHLVIYEIAR
jgi:hypothetical protein